MKGRCLIVIDVKRRKGESFDALLRRFTRRVQQSGKMLEARKIRFHSKEPNGTARQVSALRRLEIKDKREYLIKAGKYVEPEKKTFRR